jgi:hypothetical protein
VRCIPRIALHRGSSAPDPLLLILAFRPIVGWAVASGLIRPHAANGVPKLVVSRRWASRPAREDRSVRVALLSCKPAARAAITPRHCRESGASRDFYLASRQGHNVTSRLERNRLSWVHARLYSTLSVLGVAVGWSTRTPPCRDPRTSRSGFAKHLCNRPLQPLDFHDSYSISGLDRGRTKPLRRRRPMHRGRVAQGAASKAGRRDVSERPAHTRTALHVHATV